MNYLTSQEISIVSDTPGTTTDPVHKTAEIKPFGKVQLIDTAGIDDVGRLGEERVKRTFRSLRRADAVLFVVESGVWTEVEERFLEELKKRGLPIVLALNKADLGVDPDFLRELRKKGPPVVKVSCLEKEGREELVEALVSVVPKWYFEERGLLSDLVFEGDVVVLVVPIDLGAPKGRLILPQVNAIREILDRDAVAIVVKERELPFVMERYKETVKLVITDSQVVLKVSGDVPDSILLTTFSILFARYKGDLAEMVRGVKHVDKLKDGDRVLIAEACTHHPLPDDIGRVKIPRWLLQYTGKDLKFDVVSGIDFPDRITDYSLVIHCGGCMIPRREMMYRVRYALSKSVPITNYGVIISFLQGVLERVLRPFPYEHYVFTEEGEGK
jgi:[FeFe] hydrogenase H-cluster maturation GTPase HydF